MAKLLVNNPALISNAIAEPIRHADISCTFSILASALPKSLFGNRSEMVAFKLIPVE